MISIIGDIHLDESSIEEIELIFEEIISNCKDVTYFWFLGDVLNRKKPSPIEYDIITKILIRLQKIAPVLIITGNHDETTSKISALDYTRHFGIKLYNFSTVVKIGNKSYYLGHHFTDKGDEFVKDDRFKVEDLSKKYTYSFLGHNHQFIQLSNNVCHLGSIMRKSFNEVDYGSPKYAKLNPETGSVDFCEITSAIPMCEVTSIKEALKMDSRAKLRLVFTSFEEYLKSINKLLELKKKFKVFKVRHNYTQKVEKIATPAQKGRSFSEIFAKFLKESVKDKRVKSLIEESLND